MRVLHTLFRAQPIGGAEVYALATAAGQAARGDDVAVLHADPEPMLDGLHQLRMADEAEANAWVGNFAPDVVHMHGFPFETAFEGQLQARYRVVRSLHDHSYACSTGMRYFRGGQICHRTHGPVCLVNAVARGCAHRLDPRPIVGEYTRIGGALPLTRAANAVLTYSSYVRDDAVRNGVPPGRCRVIPYFTRRGDAPPPPSTNRTVSFVGRLTTAKGLDVLLEALATISAAWDSLLVVGDGWARADYEALSERLGIADRTKMLGWLETSDVAEAIRGSRVVVLPARWPEPFGIAGIEAMAQARAVVASDVGGIPEWLDHDETGFLVPPGDPKALASALAAVLGDRARAQALGEEGWRRVERFAPEAHLDALASLYDEVVR